ncbi:MAG: tetratricopeptide repeat protein, partial [Thermodesulfovibrionales bacterium]|nr:tetratricopeptide repeat protein [Thermodesulfovibrionales bacterium]
MLALTFIVYAQTLGHEFVYDDIPLIAENQLIRSPRNIPAMFFQEDMLDDFSTGYYRPVIPVIDTMAFFVSGASPAWFHFLSIIYHLVATALVYLLARRVTGTSSGALYAAAFFSLHPVNSESVAFVSAKNNAICSIFILGSVLCFLRYREGRGFFALAASAGLLFLGTLSKEFAVMVPFALLAYEYLKGDLTDHPSSSSNSASKKLRKDNYKNLLAYIPLFSVIAVFLGIRSHVLSGSAGGGLELASLSTRLSAMPDVLAAYLRLSFLPIKLSALYAFELVPGPGTLLSALLVGLVVWMAFSRRWRDLAGIPAAWFFIFLLPVMNIIPISGSPMAERYLYIPIIGVALFAGSFYALHQTRKWPRIAALLVLVVFSVLTFIRIPVWKNDEALYTHMTEAGAVSYKGWYNLGVTKYEQGDLAEARRLWELTARVMPEMYTVYNNLGVIYEQEGQYGKAEDAFRKVLSAKEMPEVYFNLANALIKQGKTDEAEAAYLRAIEMDPSGVGPYMVLSGVYERAGRRDRAIEVLREAMSHAPGQYGPYNRAGTILGSMGMYAEAGNYFRKALEIDPSCKECMYNLRQ